MTNDKVGCNFLFPLNQSRKIAVDYDEEDDILYVSYLGGPEEADDATRIGDYIVRFAGYKIIGVTILNALKHIETDFTDMPNMFKDESLVYA